MTFIQPFDLTTILGNFLAGSETVLMFIAVAFIAGLAGRFRMPNAVVLMMIALLPILVASYFISMSLLIYLVVTAFLSWSIIRWVSR